jgi:hypothetical protein
MVTQVKLGALTQDWIFNIANPSLSNRENVTCDFFCWWKLLNSGIPKVCQRYKHPYINVTLFFPTNLNFSLMEMSPSPVKGLISDAMKIYCFVFFQLYGVVQFLLVDNKSKYLYILQCIWEETTDLPQVNWQTFSHSPIGRSKIWTDADWRICKLYTSWYEADVFNHSAMVFPPLYAKKNK